MKSQKYHQRITSLGGQMSSDDVIDRLQTLLLEQHQTSGAFQVRCRGQLLGQLLEQL